MTKIHGKIIWITGAGSGIGRALALELAGRGARVALSARRLDSLQDAAKEIERLGGEALVVTADVTEPEELKRAVEKIEATWGAIDILVANAGTHIFSKLEEFDASEYMKLMETNYGGMLYSIEAVLPKMLRRGSGYIVGMASLAGFRGLPRAAAYGASKAAMIHFLESLRFHIKDQGVLVSIVNPGFVRTPLTDKNDFKMPFLVEVDRAAKIIAQGMEASKKHIYFPFPFNWFLNFARIMPYGLYEFIIDRIPWRSMTK